ncbi:uncharacterized protein P174DRAFT_1851 [Aspergillus novofumigatus IBT 16806]|uniref:Secreted protein n=1 Tax=Aspergillus novofumigatus (strain IBT 16806) TaxID=1392255 RepID=A0A2I1CK64_ASPN1|nr:uncharacterized protein P174DRAFT_1851 [Aspergillus novofumigatus IBT 16806]PKX98011.1 hypothetical protein P174DRAFT_1851 [Aspergillus novofumigatus IBT 16806]
MIIAFWSLLIRNFLFLLASATCDTLLAASNRQGTSARGGLWLLSRTVKRGHLVHATPRFGFLTQCLMRRDTLEAL